MDINRSSSVPVRGLLIGTVILILIALFSIPIFFANAAIRGQEFSPHLFQNREFTYRRLPGTKIRISKTSLSPGISPCSTSVLTHLAPGNRTDWHVAEIQQGATLQELGPKILIDYLKATDANGAQVWDAWSFRNPAHAAVLWPIVQQVAIHDLYFCVPDLFRCASHGFDITKMKRELLVICLKSARTKLLEFTEKNDSQSISELRNWTTSLVKEVDDEPILHELLLELTRS